MNKEYEVPEAAIIIVTYNSEDDIERCIRSLVKNFCLISKSGVLVHVVDNASSDETPKILAKLAREFQCLKVHLQEKNLGFGQGNNFILNSVEAKAYILINADAWLIGDSFSPSLAYLSKSPRTGILGLPLVYPDGSPQTFFFERSSWYRWVLLIFGFRRIAKFLVTFIPFQSLMKRIPLARSFLSNHSKPLLNLNDPINILKYTKGEINAVPWVAGAAMIMSSDFVKSSGGFDPNIFLYGEDEDICIQAYDLGFLVETIETIPVVHKLGWNCRKNFNPRVASLKYNSLKYFISKNIKSSFSKVMMRVILPFYVYGSRILIFFKNKG